MCRFNRTESFWCHTGVAMQVIHKTMHRVYSTRFPMARFRNSQRNFDSSCIKTNEFILLLPYMACIRCHCYLLTPSIILIGLIFPILYTHFDFTLRWRHNGRHSVSNHQPHDCLLSRLFRSRSKKTSKLRVTGLCAGNSPGIDDFPAQRASNAENLWYLWYAIQNMNHTVV